MTAQWSEQPVVWNPDTNRLVAPWPRGTPLTFEEETRLLATLARVETLKPAGPVWLWADPARAPPRSR
jgi:hypothetical protein